MHRFLVVVALTSFVNPSTVRGDECRPRKLSPAAVRLVKPLLEATNRYRENQGDRRAFDAHMRRLTALLHDRTPTGDEALAYCLTVYLGEHAGEELVCEAARRGKRLVPRIREFAACQPVTGLEPLDPALRGSGSLPPAALDAIAKGTCAE